MSEIFLLDLDGTLISTEKILEEKQISGILRFLYENKKIILKDSLLENKNLIKDLKRELREDFNEKTLMDILMSYGININLFFDKYYRTFEPFLAVASNKMRIYSDAKIFLEKKRENTKIIISNSTIKATKKKLEALNIKEEFDLILAEIRDKLQKPNLEMGIKSVNFLERRNELNANTSIYVIGDSKYDLEFSENLKRRFQDLKIKTVYMNRFNKKQKGINIDLEVSNFIEFSNLIEDNKNEN